MHRQVCVYSWLVCVFHSGLVSPHTDAPLASSEESISGPSNSTPLYESSLRNILMMSFTRKADSAEFSSWWEAFLVKCCDRCYDVFRKAVKSNTANASPGTALAAYRSWAEHREKRQRNGVTSIPQDDQVPSATPRSMWKAYYDLLSTVLQYGYTYPPKSSPLIGQESDPAGKGDQQSLGAELRRIEEVYEQFVLKENTFPEASVINHDVDDWTDQVMLNWSVLCNPHWQGEGFGAVEQIAASRHVLAVSITLSMHSHAERTRYYIEPQRGHSIPRQYSVTSLRYMLRWPNSGLQSELSTRTWKLSPKANPEWRNLGSQNLLSIAMT